MLFRWQDNRGIRESGHEDLFFFPQKPILSSTLTYLKQVALFVEHYDRMSGVSGIPHDKEGANYRSRVGYYPHSPLPKLLLVIPGVQDWSGMPGGAGSLL